MALYSTSLLKTVTLFHRGKAFLNLEASNAANTQVVNASKHSYLTRFGFFRGSLGPIASLPINNIYVKINGSWTLISEAYIYINNTWRNIVSDKIFIKVDSIWRS